METEVFYSHLTTSEPTSYALMDYPGTYAPVRARRKKNLTFQDKRTMYASGERINFKRTRDKKLQQRRQKKALLTLDLLRKWFLQCAWQRSRGWKVKKGDPGGECEGAQGCEGFRGCVRNQDSLSRSRGNEDDGTGASFMGTGEGPGPVHCL